MICERLLKECEEKIREEYEEILTTKLAGIKRQGCYSSHSNLLRIICLTWIIMAPDLCSHELASYGGRKEDSFPMNL